MQPLIGTKTIPIYCEQLKRLAVTCPIGMLRDDQFGQWLLILVPSSV